MKQVRLIAWIAVAVFGVAAAVALWTRPIGQPVVTTAGEARDYSFLLTDHSDTAVSSDAFRGKYMLVYFGYTFCPDACPTTMAKMTLALNNLAADGKDTSKFQPVFISVDPDRDTAEEIGLFRENFHPDLVALRGEKAVIDQIVANYGSYYKLRTDQGDGDAYLVDHLDVIFVVNPDGTYNQILTNDDDLDRVVAKLAVLAG